MNINIPGLEKMDSESRAQAIQAVLISELEKLQKVIERLNLVHANLEVRVKELESARTVQISLNSEVSDKLRKLSIPPPKPLETPKIANNGLLTALLSKFKRK